MKAAWARALVLSLLITGTMAFSLAAASTNASAATIDGNWVSRVDGYGYTQSYLGPYGGTITESTDAELDLSSSGSVVTGTLIIESNTYLVDGTFDGVTFVMRFFWGWDGVTMCEGVYTLTVDGDEMPGSGSYLNVGVTIYGTFDLQKEGLFAVGGIAPIVSGVTITVAIIAIVIAVTPGRAPKTGFEPRTTRVPPPAPQYTPTQQWTTEVPPQPVTGDGTTPVGGIGLHYPAPPPAGRPLPPREHYNTSQEPPRCPVHRDVGLSPQFTADLDDKGSWYCPKCKGYPWGKG